MRFDLVYSRLYLSEMPDVQIAVGTEIRYADCAEVRIQRLQHLRLLQRKIVKCVCKL